MIKIGIIKEGKTPPDERVPFSPEQCKFINDNYPNLKVVVQKSDVRRFKNEKYQNKGIDLVDNVDDCDILMGIKEVQPQDLIPNKTYFFFSHTIKKQAYNRKLLIEALKKNITLIDYETLTDKNGFRLIGFGRYAGIVGCYNTFYAYGKRTDSFDLKRAYLCHDKAEMLDELTKVKLPNNYKIVITGGGRVANGIIEILDKLAIKKISKTDFLNKSFDQPVYTQLFPEDYNKRIDNRSFKVEEFFADASGFESNFMPYAKVADMYMSGHFWAKGSPFIFSREDAKSPDFNVKVVGDISCDVDGPVACSIRSSNILSPIFGYYPETESETDYSDKNSITVMAVDNLPCELPKDASKDFGKEFIAKVLPHLLNDTEQIIERATICKNGDLMPRFEYLRDFVNGEVNA